MMTIFIIVFGILGLSLLLCFFALFRNDYTFDKGTEANRLVHNYCEYLIFNREYDSSKNYYDEMIVDYDKYFRNILLWGKNSRIKKEYRHLFENK